MTVTSWPSALGADSNKSAIQHCLNPSKPGIFTMESVTAHKAPIGKGVTLFALPLEGVGKSESVVRATNVTRRKESDVAIVQTNVDGNVALAPILGWDWDDVFGFLGLCANGIETTYSDMRDVIDTYREATGECVIASSDEEDAKASKPCQSRFGCWNCLQVKDDRSMDQMVQEPQHAYMKPLARFRTFLKNTFYDLSRRTWVGRTIDENGYIRFAVDGYSPAMLQELLKYALTIDVEEREAAARLGIAPRYQIVSLEALFAISAAWSLQGFSRPYGGRLTKGKLKYVKPLELAVTGK